VGERRPPAAVALALPKVTNTHLDLLAIVYIRQSTFHQVLTHAESRQRQYEMAQWAEALGWPAERIVVIDEDQGHSGLEESNRPGFLRLQAEVGLGHVGLVLGLELSRLSRSCLHIQQLVHLCQRHGTLLGDEEGLYDPLNTNDRLLLGLKGTMCEFEMALLKGRMGRGREHKARRAALFHGVPIGYVKASKDRVELDPDEQVRAVVRLVFDKFAELGSLGALLRYLWRHDIRLGVRLLWGARRGQLEWRRAAPSTVGRMLRHPIYAGAYVYGRTAALPAQRRRRKQVGREKWQVLEQETLPAYISWEQYEANQEQLRGNRSRPEAPGVARRGSALLGGLVVCGVCGRRMAVGYPDRGRPNYRCRWACKHAEGPACGPTVSAAPVDELVASAVLRALEPAALELHLKATEEIEKERERVDQQQRMQLERARYEADRAARQYHAVEPEHRLVARTLERDWEEALRRVRDQEEAYARFRQKQPVKLTERERGWIAELSHDVPGLWQMGSTTAAERKEIVRCLVERVAVTTREGSEMVGVCIHWAGGSQSEHQVRRPVARFTDMTDGEKMLGRVKELRQGGQTAREIAAQLNAEGFVPPQRRGEYTHDGVRQMLLRLGLTGGPRQALRLGKHEWRLADLARELRLAAVTLRAWLRNGWLRGRRVAGSRAWVAWADEAEVRRLRALAEQRKEQAHRK
jgi:DNA invertase Pin-like site-specific DNA recombinase